MPPDKLSLSTTPIALFENGKPVSRGTGFLFAYPAKPSGYVLSLVTNVHVLTGSAPRRRVPSRGDTISFQLRRAREAPDKVVTVWYSLRTRDGRPSWLGCSSFPDADVGVVPLPLGDGIFEQPPWCCDLALTNADVATYPGQAVSVIGYPLGWSDTRNKLPVWKTGHIASEPDYDFEGDPRFLIDITGRAGMSGAPVVAGHMENYLTSDGMPKFGGSGRLLGIYASNAKRRQDSPGGAAEQSLEEVTGEGADLDGQRPELGFVWRAKLIADTLAGLDLAEFRSQVWSKLAAALPP